MAIKISGTTVIDDSRNLVNVTGLKTVGGNSILGSGDIVSATGQSIGAAQLTAFSTNRLVTSTGNLPAPVATLAATDTSITAVFNDLPDVPATGVLVTYDFSFAPGPPIVKTYPRPNDQGGPVNLTATTVYGQARTKYKVIT